MPVALLLVLRAGDLQAEHSAPASEAEDEDGAGLVAAETAAPPEPARSVEIAGVRFGLEGEVRARGEVRVAPYGTLGRGDDLHFVTSRMRLGMTAEWLAARLHLQVQDARTFGEAPIGTDGGSATGMHQGYLELAASVGWLRVGRQEIALGDERLVGSFGWGSAARSFDALRIHGRLDALRLDLFGAVVRMPRTVAFERPTGDPPVVEAASARSEGDYLAGLYATYRAAPSVSMDLYVLYRHDGPTEPAVGEDPAPWVSRQRDIVAPGLRLHGEPLAGLRYKVEAVFQGGRAASERHLALAAVGELACVFPVAVRPGLALGGSYASGGGVLDEHDNFYPTNHGKYGTADLFGLRNLIEGYLLLSSTPESVPVALVLGFHLFGLAHPSGRWSSAAGVTLGASPDNEERLMGYEVDLDVSWRPLQGVTVSVGYAVFVPGPGAESLGHREPSHWGYLMAGAVVP